MAIKWLDTFFNVEDAWILWINFISAAYDDDNGYRFLYQNVPSEASNSSDSFNFFLDKEAISQK